MAQQRTDPLIGQEVGGALVERRISKGLMANVYRGRLAANDQAVGVKVLSPRAVVTGAVSPERFMREGRVIASLSHPNIIECHSMGVDGGHYFLIMDWLEDGANLHQIAAGAFIAPRRSLLIIREIADALQYLHDNGLIHRDIKPANIWLLSSGRPMIMDFSIIKPEATDIQLTAPGTIMGTVSYMPPEQAQPGGAYGRVTARSDLYSLGATLYWMLTGEPPFSGASPMETIVKLLREKVVPPSAKNPRVTPELDSLCLQALAKRPDERTASCRELIVQIEKLLTSGAAEVGQAAIRPPPLSSSLIEPKPPLDPIQAAVEEGRRESSAQNRAVPASTGLTPAPVDRTGLTPAPVGAEATGATAREAARTMADFEDVPGALAPRRRPPVNDGTTQVGGDTPVGTDTPPEVSGVGDDTDSDIEAGDPTPPAAAGAEAFDFDEGQPARADRTELDLEGPSAVPARPAGASLYADGAEPTPARAPLRQKSDSAKPVLFMASMDRRRSDATTLWILFGVALVLAGAGTVFWYLSSP